MLTKADKGSWITEELGLEYNEDGDYVDAR